MHASCAGRIDSIAACATTCTRLRCSRHGGKFWHSHPNVHVPLLHNRQLRCKFDDGCLLLNLVAVGIIPAMTTTMTCRDPYGFRRDPSTRDLVPRENEQDVVGLIQELSQRGFSAYSTARKLDSWGLPPRAAKSWASNAIRRILRRLDARSDSDPRVALAALRDAPRCNWCGAGLEVAGAPYCRKCGHRSDTADFRRLGTALNATHFFDPEILSELLLP